MADLLFCHTPAGADLVFGDECGAAAPPSASLLITAVMPGLACDVAAAYESRTQRPVVGKYRQRYQYDHTNDTGCSFRHQDASSAYTGWQSVWQLATSQTQGCEHGLPHVLSPTYDFLGVCWQQAITAVMLCGFRHQDAYRNGCDRGGRWQEAYPLPDITGFRHQDCIHIYIRRGGRWQEATPLRRASIGRFRLVGRIWSAGWLVRWQDGMAPPPGISGHAPYEPPASSCYLPSPHLLFAANCVDRGDLLFVCDHAAGPDRPIIIVPIRRIYYVNNNVTLRRASDDRPIPAVAFSLSVDVESWTWGFDATIPAAAESLLLSSDWPVELIAHVNGTDFRVLCESISRNRSFGTADVKISGRGHNALLASPYAQVVTRTNTTDRTAQQLMLDVLTINNTPIDWTVDFGITDWLVPAGAWSHQGTYIEALKTIAEAAGAYLLPHPTNKVMRVRPLYPAAPWNWAALTPDIALPSDVVQVESLRRIEKPNYNCVYVSGQGAGVLARVVRSGTAGDVVAPMVVDALITAPEAARQRGIAVLADTGRQIDIDLRLPISSSIAGIIEPGAIIDYSDGVTLRGIVRSTKIDVTANTDTWQTIGVQIYA